MEKKPSDLLFLKKREYRGGATLFFGVILIVISLIILLMNYYFEFWGDVYYWWIFVTIIMGVCINADIYAKLAFNPYHHIDLFNDELALRYWDKKAKHGHIREYIRVFFTRGLLATFFKWLLAMKNELDFYGKKASHSYDLIRELEEKVLDKSTVVNKIILSHLINGLIYIKNDFWNSLKVVRYTTSKLSEKEAIQIIKRELRRVTEMESLLNGAVENYKMALKASIINNTNQNADFLAKDQFEMFELQAKALSNIVSNNE